MSLIKTEEDAEAVGMFMGMIVAIGLFLFCIKVYSQNNIKTKQMQTDCLIQTRMKECIQIGSYYAPGSKD
jgi:uncharacterized protein with PQ loop repeat